MQVPRLISGGLITNYHCTSACGHCLYYSSPRRGKEYITPGAAVRVFSKARDMGCTSMHIGGGEPFVHPRKLALVLEAARKAGVRVEYVETNSSWFRDEAQATTLLTDLRKAGLSTILVSISPFHAGAIPFAKVRGVLHAAARARVKVFPWVREFMPDLEAMGEKTTHSLAEFEERFGPGYVKRIPERYWIHLGGRALATFGQVMDSVPLADLLEASAPCSRQLTDTSHFHIDLQGRYIPGLCTGLALDMDDLGQALDSERYPVLTCLHDLGVAGLHGLAARQGIGPARESYVNGCDLCIELRAGLRACAAYSRSPELAPQGFYREYARYCD